MATEPLYIFDPRHSFQLQGFTGRGATTTLHDASATGVSISGIFQSAEDFAVLGIWNAYDYFNHLRLKHLPRTDLSSLKLEFDIEYDHALDGAMRLDATKYPSVSWDAITFVCGAGDLYDVKLLDHAAVLAGTETPATAQVDLTAEAPKFGVDWFHVFFRDTRYTVAHTDCIVEKQLTNDVPGGGETWFEVDSVAGLRAGDWVYIERTGANEELVFVLEADALLNRLRANVTISHPAGSYVTLRVEGYHIAARLAELINDPTLDPIPGRYGPCQAAVISAEGGANGVRTGPGDPIGSYLRLSFLPNSNYGKLGNLDRVFTSSGHQPLQPPYPPGYDPQQDVQSGYWLQEGARFTGGDNDKTYHVTLDFTQGLRDTLNRVVPVNDCRKIYMVFAPRFEPTEQELEDGCALAAGIGATETVWQVDDSSKLSGGRYFIGTDSAEERVRLVSVDSPTQITVERGYEGSAPGAWLAGARMKKLSPMSGFASDVEWRVRISNIAVTGDASLKVGGGAERIEESDKRCEYVGYWEDYAYGGGFPKQWWSRGHARRAAPNDPGDTRKVAIRYSYPRQHALYLGTFLDTSCGKIGVSVDGGPATTHDLYLNEYGGTTANLKLRDSVAAGNHTVEITALFERNPASSGYYFYFDYLWPLEPVDVPDAPEEYPDVSLAIDFDTDHGYKKPPAWHLWQLQKLGFRGHADVYMGVFWNNKRRRVGASYPHATVEFSGDPVPGDVVSITISGTPVNHAIGYGETLQQIVSQMRAAINAMFVGVWADDNFGSSTTLRIQSKAPSWTFPGISVSAPNSVTLALTNNLGTPGAEGDWELVDAVSPVMTEGVRQWIRDLAGQFQAAGIQASFAFSMEVYNPPAAMRAKYLNYVAGVVSPGNDVYLEVPSHQMHFGPRVRNYLKQMYKECADEIAAAGLPVILQFGETQYWYFDNRSQDPNGGMGFYDQDAIDEFRVAKGHQIWPFRANTDDPAGDPAHPYETADFLRDRIWQYCRDVISYVRSYHPAALFECLWPLDANQGQPAPNPAFRRLLMHVNLPNEWKNSSYGVKYFRVEGLDYDVWQKNAVLMRQTMTYPNEVLGRPAEECIYLAGIYGPPDPPMAQAYGLWRAAKLYSMCFWALDQFCLNSRPVPLETWSQARATAVAYHKPRAARALEAVRVAPVAVSESGALNRFKSNERKCNE